MPMRFAAVCGAVLLAAAALSCARQVDDAPPFATPVVTVKRTDLAVGSPFEVTYRFSVAAGAPAPQENDYWVFVHFLDPDRELMWTDDHQPPQAVQQWKPGSVVEYTRSVFVPRLSYVGEVTVEVGIYSPRTGERLPLAGDNAGMRSYRVARVNVLQKKEDVFVVFRQGWQPPEVADDGTVEWQWSRKDGILTFKNPNRDVVLWLDVDQPAQAFAEPQNVEVRVGEAVVDTFALPAGRRELRKIRLTPAQFGTSETVEAHVAVDRTFVPASTPQLKSQDTRELGIRVFRAYVEPI